MAILVEITRESAYKEKIAKMSEKKFKDQKSK